MTIILINDVKLSSGIIIYTASKQRKARTKTTLIKFLMSRNIRSLCNTTHSNERYVPITGYRRHNCTKTKYINSLGHHTLIMAGFTIIWRSTSYMPRAEIVRLIFVFTYIWQKDFAKISVPGAWRDVNLARQ